MLHALAASHVLRICKLPLQNASASSLNDIVAAFPHPAEAVRMMGLNIGDCPILFVDVTMAELAKMLGKTIFDGEAPWPIFYMPLNAMDGWASDPNAQNLLAYLRSNGLDVQLTVGGSQTWLRDHWVVLCDMRIRFARDVTLLEMQEVALLPPPTVQE